MAASQPSPVPYGYFYLFLWPSLLFLWTIFCDMFRFQSWLCVTLHCHSFEHNMYNYCDKCTISPCEALKNASFKRSLHLGHCCENTRRTYVAPQTTLRNNWLWLYCHFMHNHKHGKKWSSHHEGEKFIFIHMQSLLIFQPSWCMIQIDYTFNSTYQRCKHISSIGYKIYSNFTYAASTILLELNFLLMWKQMSFED